MANDSESKEFSLRKTGLQWTGVPGLLASNVEHALRSGSDLVRLQWNGEHCLLIFVVKRALRSGSELVRW